MFFREFWEIFKNIYLVEHLQTAAYVSENLWIDHSFTFISEDPMISSLTSCIM